MPYRTTPFVNQYFYHIFNRGVEKRQIFTNNNDYRRFLETMIYYQYGGPKPSFSKYQKFHDQSFKNNPKIVDIVCYCLMPNHFHLLLKQNEEHGVSEFISKVTNGYTKFFNIKHNRIGPLLQGAFKAVLIESDEQLLQVARYIHLNPYVSELVNDLEKYNYSSHLEFLGESSLNLCSSENMLRLFKSPLEYKNFITDYQDYALRLEHIKDLLIDEH